MRRMLCTIMLVCIAFALISGCQGDVPNTTEYVGDSSSTLETVAIETSLQTTKLSIESWDTPRTQQSSALVVAETEAGFYMRTVRGSFLYADKADLTNWVVVCTKPQCDHRDREGIDGEVNHCNGYFGTPLLQKGDRFYFVDNKDVNPALWNEDPKRECNEQIIASFASDGTDFRVEYAYTMPITSSMRQMATITSTHALYVYAAINQTGTYDTKIIAADEEGVFELYAGEENERVAHIIANSHILKGSVYGEPVFQSENLDPGLQNWYKIENRQLIEYDLTGVDFDTGYLEDNSLLLFRQGEGYFRLNTDTKEEVKLSDPQLPHSTATVFYPNCILESTFTSIPSKDFRDQLERHEMKFFDGETWYDVELPEDLQDLPDGAYLRPMGVTSDRIFITYYYLEGEISYTHIYQILLGTDHPVLELVATVEL